MDFRRRLRGPDTLADTSVSARPLSDGPADCLLRLKPNGHMGAQVTPVGCLAAPTHYSSEHNLCTIMMHHHSTAKALFAGFRSRNELPRVLRPFVGSNSEGNHFCLCRPGDVCASGQLCNNAVRLTVTVHVRWHCQVSCARAAL